MSLSNKYMKKTHIRYTDSLGTAYVIRGAVIASLGLLSGDVRFAGGAARDMLDAVEPKDYDLIIPRCSFNRPVYDGAMCTAEAFDHMSDMMKDLQLALGDGVQVEIYQAYDQSSGDFDERLLCAGTVKWHGVQVDVLMSTSDTLLAALEGFDSDINQAYIKGGYVLSVDAGSYKMLKPQRSECRYHKLLAVAQRRGTHLERFKE
ncbi:nucleotidyltransferase [Aeromonas phage phiAS7]|uniref:Uncharacterized protein n=1 Tax=Aeromonas phage phiAS7 TaxID=1141132 RepID=H6UK10_9CAUD|nr:nucleotidyltransferase [Aeromonas phage phiAS7]AEZ65028.1 hypothetical protein phiAS7_00003 [Aeromonas phage phiAS7]